MNFIEQLTKCPDDQLYSAENIVIAECIRSLKKHLETKHMRNESINRITGYFESDRETVLFGFREATLTHPPQSNTGISGYKQLVLQNKGFPKEPLDWSYFCNELKNQLIALGFHKAKVNIYVNPTVIYKTEMIRNFWKPNQYKQIAEVHDPKGFTCIYLEAEL